MKDPRTRNEERELLEQRIEESGLRTSAFARDVLIREPRTVRRWLAGESPIPNRVKEWLADPTPAPWPLEEPGGRDHEAMEKLRECGLSVQAEFPGKRERLWWVFWTRGTPTENPQASGMHRDPADAILEQKADDLISDHDHLVERIRTDPEPGTEKEADDG